MSDIKSILVFGATGSCGQAIVERGLNRGHRISAYVRNADKARQLFGTNIPNLDVIAGDLADENLIQALLEKNDAVISCLSSFETPHDRMSLLASILVRASTRLELENYRFLTYSLCGVLEDGDWISHSIQNVLRLVSPKKFGPAIQDHQRVAKILAHSSLDYTLFQTATMIDKPIGEAYRSGNPEHCAGVRLWDRWGVLDAADVCLDALDKSGLTRLQMRYVV